MATEVFSLQADREGAWEAYLAGHARATLFHTLAWRDAVEAAFGHRSHYLYAERDGRMVGVFPLGQVASRLAGTILVSVPYGIYGGVLADDDQAADALLSAAMELAGRLGAHWVDIRSAEALHPALPTIDKYVTFRKALPSDPQQVAMGLPRKARAAARQAVERHGLRVERGDQHLSAVWSLYSQSMRRLASPNYPLKFFEELLARTPGPSAQSPAAPGHLVQLVLQGERPVAGLVSFFHRGTLMPYFVGCDERYEKCCPNNLLYLTAMEEAVRLGCREFDFGRSRSDNVGSCHFKHNQGFEPTPLGYQYFVPAGGRAPDLYPTNPKVQLARWIWPRLPLAVTRPLGAWLSKSIPG
ncbi:MAG: FemAB family PEP-CTERM system-associated protein [Phycisphaerae bacterium]